MTFADLSFSMSAILPFIAVYGNVFPCLALILAESSSAEFIEIYVVSTVDILP